MYRINRPNNDAVGLTMTPASGTAKDPGGNPVTGVTGITFALYAEQTGGAPLWSETQRPGRPRRPLHGAVGRGQIRGSADRSVHGRTAAHTVGKRAVCAEGRRCGDRRRSAS